MARGKSINLFLMDGTPTGIIKCTITNWTGIVYKIPRSDIYKFNERKDLKQSGVYCLFGTLKNTEMTIYIGQAGNRKNGEGILQRLNEHNKDSSKDFWTDAIVLTTSNNSFGPTEISYIENKLCNLAIKAQRCKVTNNNDPSPGNVTEEKESELEEFLDLVLIIVGVLGYNVFEPIPIVQPQMENADNLLYLKRRIKSINSTINAIARQVQQGFIVLKGSQISPKTDSYISSKAKRIRSKAKIDSNNILMEDIIFDKPSPAAEFVIGKTANGWTAWKNKYGIPLNQLENRGDKL